MSDVSGIPNMGFGGGGYFGGIPNQQPAMSAAQINAGMWGNYSPQQAQNTLNNIYGAGGFGAQPAYYAALGAAYGRQVAPSSPAAVAAYHGGGGGGYPSGQVERGPDLQAPPWQNPITSSPWEGAGFDPVQYLQQNPDVAAAGANPWEHAQRYGFEEGRSGLGWNPVRYLADNPDVKAAGVNPWEHAQNFGFKENRAGLEGLTQTDAGRNALAKAMQAAQPKNPYAGMILGPGGNPSYFNPGTYAGDQSNYGLPFNPAGVPRAPTAMPNSMQLLGYDPNTSASFAPGAANTFQGRFGMGFPGAGTPSQVMPDYGNTLTNEDRYLNGYSPFAGNAPGS